MSAKKASLKSTCDAVDDVPLQGSYRINEVFLSMQGEGCNSGTPAVFVRFAGCNMADGHCKFCDIDHSHKATHDTASLIAEIRRVASAIPFFPPLVVFTGGEPMMQIDAALLAAVDAMPESFAMCFETNGTVANAAYDAAFKAWSRKRHFITLSPKRGAKVLDPFRQYAHEIKIVYPGTGPDGGEGWTDEELTAIAKRFDNKPLFLQPERCADPALSKANMDATAKVVMRVDGWRFDATESIANSRTTKRSNNNGSENG